MDTRISKNNSLRLPGEWEDQSGVILVWPPAVPYWKPILNESRLVFANLIRLLDDETVICLTENSSLTQSFLKEQHVKNLSVRYYEMPTDDIWVRDFGPITVYENGRPNLRVFRFNAWGNKYNLQADDICKNLVERGVFGPTPVQYLDVVLEGGSIESDGAGVVMVTAQCLLKRNPGLDTKPLLEQYLESTLGARKVLWLHHGYLMGDDTDAHIDTLARFCDPNTICYQSCDDSTDPHYESLKKMEQELLSFTNVEGEKYQCIPLPWPKPKFSRLTKDRLPATYANFLISNQKIIMPCYEDEADGKALAILQQQFASRQVWGVDSLPLLENFGSFHCASMQLPRGVLV